MIQTVFNSSLGCFFKNHYLRFRELNSVEIREMAAEALAKLDELLEYVENYKPSSMTRDKSVVPTATRSWESVILYSSMTDAGNAIKDCSFEFMRNVDKVEKGLIISYP